MAKTEKTAAMVKSTPKGGALAPMEPWEMEIAAKAKQAQAAEVVGVPRIKHRGGILKVDDKKVEGNKLQVVIACYGRVNTYFEKEFDDEAAKGETPDCYAFGDAQPGAEETMKPHAAAPRKQAEQCQGCKWNEFGSGKGNGKACGNRRKLLVFAPSDDPESLVKGQLRQIDVPPGSLKNWGNYLSSIEEVTPLGHLGVVTEISTEPSDRGAYRLTFRCVDKLDREFVKVIYEKVPSIVRHLSEPFPVVTKTEEKPAKRRSVKGQ